MAYTVEIIATPASGNVLAVPRTGGTGTANVAGYAITLVAGNLHTITIAESLVGPWVLTAGDGLSQRVLTFDADTTSYPLGNGATATKQDEILAAVATKQPRIV